MRSILRGGLEILGLTGLAIIGGILLSGAGGEITPHRISDGLFWIGLIYLLIAAFPAVAEMGSKMAAPWHAIREHRSIQEVLYDQRAQYAPWETVTGRFGLAGFLCLAIGLWLGFR